MPTANQIWLKLHTSLNDQCTKTIPSSNREDVRKHIYHFRDPLDMLNVLDVSVNDDLPTIFLLYCLTDKFENFQMYDAISGLITISYVFKNKDCRRKA